MVNGMAAPFRRYVNPRQDVLPRPRALEAAIASLFHFANNITHFKYTGTATIWITASILIAGGLLAMKMFRRGDRGGKAAKKKKKHQDQDDGDVGDNQTSNVVDNDDIGETRAGEPEDKESRDSSETVRPTKTGDEATAKVDEVLSPTPPKGPKKARKKGRKSSADVADVQFTTLIAEGVKLKKTITNDRSAPKLDFKTGTSAGLPVSTQPTTNKGKEKEGIICKTASNAVIAQDSNRNTYTRLDQIGGDELPKFSPKALKIGGDYQLSDEKDTHKLSSKVPSGHRYRASPEKPLGQEQEIFHKQFTGHEQVQSPEKPLDDVHNEVKALDTVDDSGATAGKENTNPARKFFNSLRGKKSKANLSKDIDSTMIPDVADLFFSPPSIDISRKQSKVHVMDTITDEMPGPFNKASVPTVPVSGSTTLSGPANMDYGPPPTSIDRKPVLSLDTTNVTNEAPQHSTSGRGSAGAELLPLHEGTQHDDYSTEEGYVSPETTMGSPSMLSPGVPPDDPPNFTEYSNVVKKFKKLHLQTDYGISSTRDLLSPTEEVTFDIGSVRGSGDSTNAGFGSADLTRAETTTRPSTSTTEAARKMAEMSIAVDNLHAAAEASGPSHTVYNPSQGVQSIPRKLVDSTASSITSGVHGQGQSSTAGDNRGHQGFNNTGLHEKSPETAHKSQKKNYSAGMEEAARTSGGPETAARLAQLKQTNFIEYMEELIRTGSNLTVLQLENLAQLRRVDYIAYIELLFRTTTGTEIISRGFDPRHHPKHQRHWDSKNLWCDHHGKHISVSCKICGRACCAFMKAMQDVKHGTNTVEEKIASERFLRELMTWKSMGKDASTFINCTECHEDVCQGCASICPVFPCHDTLCINCNPQPWQPCDWHNVI